MKIEEYATCDAVGLAELIRQKHVSAAEVAQTALSAIEQLNPDLNCVIETHTPEWITDSAAPFYGVPLLLKDFPMAQGVRAEMGCQLAQGNVSNFDSNVWLRLKQAGFVNLGRSTTSELGINAVTETRICGGTRNPWDLNRSVAGSSGGSAAAVASGLVPVAHATDGGGSIRNPASFCGLVGLKPSRGRVSAAPGLVSGLGGVGHSFMLTRTVRDCATLLDVLSGPCGGDFIELPAPDQRFADAIANQKSHPLRIGVARESWSNTPITPEVLAALDRVIEECQRLGHMVELLAAPFDYGTFYEAQKTLWAVNLRVAINELAQCLNRVPSDENLQSTTMALYVAAERVEGEAYAQAQRALGRCARQMATAFDRFDLLLSPTALHVPEPVGSVDIDLPNATLDDVFQQLEPKETFTAPFNVSGHPAISLPLGRSKSGLPIGIQFAAGFGQEALLLQIASALENGLLWISARPDIHLCSQSVKQTA